MIQRRKKVVIIDSDHEFLKAVQGILRDHYEVLAIWVASEGYVDGLRRVENLEEAANVIMTFNPGVVMLPHQFDLADRSKDGRHLFTLLTPVARRIVFIGTSEPAKQSYCPFKHALKALFATNLREFRSRINFQFSFLQLMHEELTEFPTPFD